METTAGRMCLLEPTMVVGSFSTCSKAACSVHCTAALLVYAHVLSCSRELYTVFTLNVMTSLRACATNCHETGGSGLRCHMDLEPT